MAETIRTDTGANRRDLFKGAVGLGAAAVALGDLGGAGVRAAAAAQPAGTITKAIPRTGERVPAIGLGTFLTFDCLPGRPRAHLQEVVRRFWDAGGRVVDTSPLYGSAEVSVGAAKAALGLDEGMFVANKIWSTGDFLADESHALRSLEQSRLRLWRDRIDAFQCHSLVNVEIVVPLLKAWKREGSIRFVGATHHDPLYFAALASWVERGDLDLVQVHYSIAERRAEERILPAALAQGTAVFVNMPLEKARLMKLVEGRPLPDFAREFEARSWAQFFLKWVISHPAVTCALPATADPEHASDNMGALSGPLPDAAMRERMVRFMETVSGFSALASTPWYPGKSYPGLIARAQNALKARS